MTHITEKNERKRKETNLAKLATTTTSMTTLFSEANQNQITRKKNKEARRKHRVTKHKNYTPFCVHSPLQMYIYYAFCVSSHVVSSVQALAQYLLFCFKFHCVPILCHSLNQCVCLQVALWFLSPVSLTASRSIPMNLILLQLSVCCCCCRLSCSKNRNVKYR